MSPQRVLTDQDIETLEHLIDYKIDTKLDEFIRVTGRDHNKIITMLQEVMGEIQATRQEQTLLFQKDLDLDEELEAVKQEIVTIKASVTN